MISVITLARVALDSLDHTEPLGTKHDNHTSLALIKEIEARYEFKKINYLDIGCAGGQFVADMYHRGHNAVGIEGSDYSLVHQRACWPELGNIRLFTCDATKRFEIMDDQTPMLFDLITAWEVLEHIKIDDMKIFFSNINRHLKPNGIFIGSVSCHGNDPHHVTVLPKDIWHSTILPQHFGQIFPYPFTAWLRDDIRVNSFVFMGTKKWSDCC